MIYFNETIATRYGVNAAVVAEYLMSEFLCSESTAKNIRCLRNREYCRCGARMLSGELMCLSQHQVRHAFNKLVEKGVLVKKQLSKSEFDNTNWYAFTDYGWRLARDRDGEQYELYS
ncbi:MAG: hypothetical protein E7571_00110 [Ruminococcaceae bacterium]|nr:hypothetical protein [Oscillospiraceae bacterium]